MILILRSNIFLGYDAYLRLKNILQTDLNNPTQSIKMNTIQFKKLHPEAIIPTRGTDLAVGFDLYALEDTVIEYGAGNKIVKTGIAVQMVEGTYGRIAMRSGLAVRQHLGVSAGVIDLDYVDPIGVVTFCCKERHSYEIKKGERFAQLIIEQANYYVGEEVEEFTRSFGQAHEGYGSTGKT